MRLLHSTTIKLHEFVGSQIPPYAILSHTWDDEEVSFQELQSGNTLQKKGFEKIKRCCEIAAEDGFEYAWVDTCCIDKTSSAELSEAINSMYRWYKKAEVCYAFLSDVPSDEDPHKGQSAFRKSRWFTRGWTLQELIAPMHLTFLGSDWREIGSKLSLQDLVSEITKIHTDALVEGRPLGEFSVAQKMSWASNRDTRREEDIAYCLMGIFDINMPMLYGEGPKAFIRLQEQIITNSEDDSIFAWWDMENLAYRDRYGQGLLALSPRFFSSSGNVRRASPGVLDFPSKFSWSGSLIRWKAPVLRSEHSESISYLVLLKCRVVGGKNLEDCALGIRLNLRAVPRGSNMKRVELHFIHTIPNSEMHLFKRETMFVEKISGSFRLR
jgi:hypothetical protein